MNEHSPSLSMSYFESASEFEINGGQFNVVHGNVYNYSGQHADSTQGDVSYL